jgi:hypothetical protein
MTVAPVIARAAQTRRDGDGQAGECHGGKRDRTPRFRPCQSVLGELQQSRV